MTGTSNYNSQLTPVYLLNTEKIGHVVLPFVFIMIFPTSPLGNKTAGAVKLCTVRDLVASARKGFMKKVRRMPWCQD